jgi:hypothetical protein
MEKRNNVQDHQRDGASHVQRSVCSWATLFAIVVALLFLVFQEKAMAKGILLGTLFSILNFILLGKSIPLALGQTRTKAGMIGLVSIFGRYALLAIPMVIAIKSSSINFVAVVVGIFAVQIVTLIQYIIVRPLLDGK